MGPEIPCSSLPFTWGSDKSSAEHGNGGEGIESLRLEEQIGSRHPGERESERTEEIRLEGSVKGPHGGSRQNSKARLVSRVCSFIAASNCMGTGSGQRAGLNGVVVSPG